MNISKLKTEKRRLLSFISISIVLISTFFCGINDTKKTSKPKEPVDFVNPFIGTDKEGNTFPGACLPFGMVQLSPDNGYQGVKAYNYAKTTILGFSHTQLSGTGDGTLTNYCNILIMPTVGYLKVFPGVSKSPDRLARRNVEMKMSSLSNEEKQKLELATSQERRKKFRVLIQEERQKIMMNLAKSGVDTTILPKGYESGYSHTEEEATPGYYAVQLKDYNVKAELTATERAGFHRYTFPETDNAHIIIDVTHSLTADRDASVAILNKNQIEGYVITDQEGSNTNPLKCYFFAEFNKSFTSYGTWSGDSIKHDINSMHGKDGIGAFVNFSTSKGEQLLIKVGISFVSIDGAKKNLAAEIPDWDFDKIRMQAKNTWNKKLNKISVKGGTESQKTTFYTSMYHSLMFPRTFSDANGTYFSQFDNTVHQAKSGRYYVDFSLWDTYRAEHPLLAYLEPERQNEMINTFLEMYDQGGRIPLYVCYKNYYMKGMIGDHAASVIADSYMKGIRGYNIDKAYEAMRKNAMEPGEIAESRTGLNYYKELGYIPADKVRESVSVTMEYAYDDWCLAMMAKAMGKQEDYLLFSKRALYYQNLFDKSTGFMRPKKADGSWLEMCNEPPKIIRAEDGRPYYSCFDPLWVGVSPNRHFTESNAWQYLWHVPYDIQGLMNTMGGKKEFLSKLDTLFTMTPNETGPAYAPEFSKIGQYVHGNEPVHHVAYLFNYAGEPWKTQKRVRQIMDEKYISAPDGLCGNDDMGQMSAWYIFSALGFYPVAPGQNVFVIGTPIFEESTLDLGAYFGNQKFTVKAQGVSSSNFYIQSATLNGKTYNKSWITHEDIVKGGILIFKMGSKPNNQWGNNAEDIPPSLSRN
ncbi:MAG: GH92 family glycosyl hydrolase [Mariniphaga sp.]